MDYEMPSALPVRLHLLGSDEQLAFTAGQIRHNLALILHDLEQVKNRLLFLAGSGTTGDPVFEWHEPDTETAYGKLLYGQQKTASSCERILLLLALAPHLPQCGLMETFDAFKNNSHGKVSRHGARLNPLRLSWEPTLQTALFICAGDDIYSQQEVYARDVLTSQLLREQVIVFIRDADMPAAASEKTMSPVLDEAYVHHLLYGRVIRPDFGAAFPAHLVSTTLEFRKHIFLYRHTQTELDVLAEKIRELKTVRNSSLTRGLPVLFCGPPGTGKTISARAIGNSTGLPVFRIDLANVVSKYVGETEKKLAAIFDRAEGKNWILFFDEADVLFGNRTGVGDAHDRYANLLTAFLLQRIEEYEGVCILSTNFKGNIDPAMLRRFTQVINFRLPEHQERLNIWKNSIAEGFFYQPGLSLRILAQFELTGAQIAMILKNATIRAAAQQSVYVQANDIKFFTSLEFAKQGISTRIKPWPGESISGFEPAIAMENPLEPNLFYDVKERHSVSNVNLFNA